MKSTFNLLLLLFTSVGTYSQVVITNAYSVTMVEHFLLNISKKFSVNGYGVFTKSKGGSRVPTKTFILTAVNYTIRRLILWLD